MRENTHIALSEHEKKYLKKKLNIFLDQSKNDDEEKIINSILAKLNINSKITLYIDGAALPSRGGSGIGGICYKYGEKLFSFSEYIGGKTNNEAEYLALVKGLDKVINRGIKIIEIFSDSELVVKQINGDYLVKNKRMKELYVMVNELLHQLDFWTLKHIPRENNIEADALSKEGLLKSKYS